MKRITGIGTCFLLLLMIAATGCEKDEPQVTIMKTDDISLLLANLVFTDDNGNITGYMTGYGLNEADPGELSIPCESFEKAQEIFLRWVPEEADVTSGEGALRWNMTDTAGVYLGTTILRAGGAKGAVAHLELPERFPVVTGVQFLPKSAFPQNAELDYDDALDDYYFLNWVNVYPEQEKGHGGGAMLVIREYDQETNTSGILLATPDKEWNSWNSPVLEHDRLSRTSDELKIVQKQYKQYAKSIDPVLTAGTHFVDGNHWFACVEYFMGDSSKLLSYRMNLLTGDYEGRGMFHPTYYLAYVYFFTLEKKDGVYQVVLK